MEAAKLQKTVYFCKEFIINDEMKIIISLLFLCLSVKMMPQSATYGELVQKSADFIDSNQLDSAAVTLQKAMSLEPANENNPVLLLNLGILQRQLGLVDDAYISFTAATANNVHQSAVLHNRASLLCDLNRFDEAMEDYNSLIRLNENDVEAYYRRGILHLENDDRAKAEADFRKSEQIDPDHLFTKLSKALLFKLDDNWVAAERIYTQLIDSPETTNSIFYLNRAECYVNTNQIFKASADLRTAEPAQRENPYFYFLRGRVRLEQFDKIAARADFNKAIDLGYDPELTDGWIEKTK